VRAIDAVKIDLERQPDGSKRAVELPGGDLEIPADLVILAIGFVGPEDIGLTAELGLELDRGSGISVDASYATSLPGVFAAGDAMRGASLIVWAIADGRAAARSVDRYLAALPARAA
jgi:glutamate synthase (NADPH/NADH) small chain